jgi:hypothetical protein
MAPRIYHAETYDANRCERERESDTLSNQGTRTVGQGNRLDGMDPKSGD